MEINIEKLKKLPGKNQHESFSIELIENLLEKTDAVSAFVYLKFYSEIFNIALKDDKFRNVVLSNISDQGEERFGVTIEAKGGRKVYDYNNDSQLAKLEKEYEEIKEKIKNRKTMLESMRDDVVDPETGEIITPAKLVSAGIVPVVKFK